MTTLEKQQARLLLTFIFFSVSNSLLNIYSSTHHPVHQCIIFQFITCFPRPSTANTMTIAERTTPCTITISSWLAVVSSCIMLSHKTSFTCFFSYVYSLYSLFFSFHSFHSLFFFFSFFFTFSRGALVFFPFLFVVDVDDGSMLVSADGWLLGSEDGSEDG